jgi:mannose-6-phosphate isomerase-like protein (cupin superfamily)/pyrroloquinoline quinone (PQQ) biosynthesis protein C
MVNFLLEKQSLALPQTASCATKSLDSLSQFAKNHSFWDNRLFAACLAGELTRDDFTYLFSQYYLYSKNFTRYIAGVMANCDKDNFRAKLTQNLWEESGEESGISHAEIFRNFLKTSLGITDLSKIEYEDFTRSFVEIYLENSMQSNPLWGSAWLSLGTEGIVSDMYQIMVTGMRQAGFDDTELEFFHIHIGCDDEHAATLAELMCSYETCPDWHEKCTQATDLALSARAHFFDCLYAKIFQGLNRSLVTTIESRKSLAKQVQDIASLKASTAESGTKIYSNSIPHLNIEFAVDRLDFPVIQVLDPRIVHIPAGKNNEKHRHAHEAVFYILQGCGKVMIDDRSIDVVAGDIVFLPRWCIHQSQNTGDTDMQILAITDFGLTSKVLGDYDRQTRMK